MEDCRVRVITSVEAEAVLKQRRDAGLNVDQRLMTEVSKAGQLYRFRFEDQDSFLSLIWTERDDSRLLTPGGPRTLRDVARRFICDRHTFRAIAGPLGKSKYQHDPAWFGPCVPIDEQFDFDKFGWVAVTPANDSEQQQTPAGTFYLYDGSHKSLVLSVKLLKQQIAYRPVEALYLVPRR
jgi:hypothetical protein